MIFYFSCLVLESITKLSAAGRSFILPIKLVYYIFGPQKTKMEWLMKEVITLNPPKEIPILLLIYEQKNNVADMR